LDGTSAALPGVPVLAFDFPPAAGRREGSAVMGGQSRSRVLAAVVATVSAAVPLWVSGGAGAQGAPDGPTDALHADIEISGAPAPRRTDVALTSSALREAVARAEAGLALPAGVDAAGGAGGEVLVEVHSSLPPDELAALVEA